MLRSVHAVRRLLVRSLLPLALSAPPLAAQTWIGQSFTVPGTPNVMLQMISATGMGGSSTSSIMAHIFKLDGANLSGPSLFSQSLVSSFSGFSLTPNVTLTAGQEYGVFVDMPGAGSFIAVSVDDAYGGGSYLECFGTSCTAAFGSADITGFSVQFGPASVVPEPGTVVLLGTGLLALGGVAVRRRRSA